MRTNLRYSYKKYPLSEKMTRRSKTIGYYTGPTMALIYGFLIALVVWAITGINSLLLIVTLVCGFAGLAVLPIIRNSIYKKMDVKYSDLTEKTEQS